MLFIFASMLNRCK